jgi:hypothetical protein
MTARAATSNSAVDTPSAWSDRATSPVTPTRAEASEALPGVFAEMPPAAVALTWDLTRPDVADRHDAAPPGAVRGIVTGRPLTGTGLAAMAAARHPAAP